MFGRGTRAYALSDEVIAKGVTAAGVSRETVADNPDPRAFCVSCHGCSYETVCDMRLQKLKADKRRTAAAWSASSSENASQGRTALN